MTNFKILKIGKLDDVSKNYANGKAFLHDLLDLTSCEISVNSMSAGVKLPFNINVKEGDCIKVLPEAVRTMEAKSDLQYICIQAKTNSLEQFGLGDAELC